MSVPLSADRFRQYLQHSVGTSLKENITAANETEILNQVLDESREWYTVERKKTERKKTGPKQSADTVTK
jgi:hypothetical protein